jgi:hypothetical protein
MFACPSPKGTNHAQLFLNSKGELIDGKTGRYWGRSSKMAHDELPESLRSSPGVGKRDDVDERLNAMRQDVEGVIEKLYLNDESKGAIIKAMLKHCDAARERPPVRGKDAARGQRRARDQEPDHEGLVRFLRSGEEEPSGEDVLAVSGPLHAALARQTRQAGEKPFRDPAQFSDRYPETDRLGADRLGCGLFGSSQFDPAPPLSSRDKRQAHDAAGAEARLAKKFPGIENVKVGEWPERR